MLWSTFEDEMMSPPVCTEDQRAFVMEVYIWCANILPWLVCGWQRTKVTGFGFLNWFWSFGLYRSDYSCYILSATIIFSLDFWILLPFHHYPDPIWIWLGHVISNLWIWDTPLQSILSMLIFITSEIFHIMVLFFIAIHILYCIICDQLAFHRRIPHALVDWDSITCFSHNNSGPGFLLWYHWLLHPLGQMGLFIHYIPTMPRLWRPML